MQQQPPSLSFESQCLLRVCESVFRVCLLRVKVFESVFRVCLLRVCESVFLVCLLRVFESVFRVCLLRVCESVFRVFQAPAAPEPQAQTSGTAAPDWEPVRVRCSKGGRCCVGFDQSESRRPMQQQPLSSRQRTPGRLPETLPPQPASEAPTPTFASWVALWPQPELAQISANSGCAGNSSLSTTNSCSSRATLSAAT
jgi:hypothetical protein